MEGDDGMGCVVREDGLAYETVDLVDCAGGRSLDWQGLVQAWGVGDRGVVVDFHEAEPVWGRIGVRSAWFFEDGWILILTWHQVVPCLV